MKSQQFGLCLQDGARLMGRLIIGMEMAVSSAGLSVTVEPPTDTTAELGV